MFDFEDMEIVTVYTGNEYCSMSINDKSFICFEGTDVNGNKRSIKSIDIKELFECTIGENKSNSD